MSPRTPPRVSAPDKFTSLRSRRRSSAASPAFSSASTADGEASSPDLPPLPAPRLPERVRGLLRTPPDSPAESEGEAAQSGTNHWGSPYPPHLRSESSSSDQGLSSDASEDSPIHRLELQTPFLRPAPPVPEPLPEVRLPGLSAAATVLANRARRLANGITEGWIRQHTAGGSDQEKRHWFSDGTGDSENSSLSGSFSGEEAAWLGYDDVGTPKAGRSRNSSRRGRASRGDLTKQSSSETLKQSHLDRKKRNAVSRMASSDELATPASLADYGPVGNFTEAVRESLSRIERPRTPTIDHKAGLNGSTGVPNSEHNLPVTPSKAAAKRTPNAATPRIKKKVPWKGKSVLVLLPRDEERGLPGKRPFPLKESDVTGMLRSWRQLGYNIDGFDLYEPTEEFGPTEKSQSRGAWPDFDDLARERERRGWKVLLPDLNGRCPSLQPSGANTNDVCSMEEVRRRAERGKAPRARGFVRGRGPATAVDFSCICHKQASINDTVSSASLLPSSPDFVGIEQPGNPGVPLPRSVHNLGHAEPWYPSWRLARSVRSQVQPSGLDFGSLATCMVSANDASTGTSRGVAIAC